eukprot:COSAG02_NODE_1182_length_14021_cov_4.502442_6_plen_256_part_00
MHRCRGLPCGAGEEIFWRSRGVAYSVVLVEIWYILVECSTTIGTILQPRLHVAMALIPAPSFELAQTCTVGPHGCWDCLAGVPASSNEGFALGASPGGSSTARTTPSPAPVHSLDPGRPAGRRRTRPVRRARGMDTRTIDRILGMNSGVGFIFLPVCRVLTVSVPWSHTAEYRSRVRKVHSKTTRRGASKLLYNTIVVGQELPRACRAGQQRARRTAPKASARSITSLSSLSARSPPSVTHVCAPQHCSYRNCLR